MAILVEQRLAQNVVLGAVDCRVLRVRHDAVQQTSLIVVLGLQIVTLQIQCVKLTHQVVALDAELLASDRELPHLFILFDKFVSGSVELSFTLIDLSHVAAGFESVFLRQLALVLAETLNLLVKTINCEGLLLVFFDLLVVVLLELFGLFHLLLQLLCQLLVLFNLLGEGDFDASLGLLELLDFGQGGSERDSAVLF